MHIPLERLAPDVLRGIVEEFVTREGTDYGDEAYTLDQKIDHVMRQLKAGKAAVAYDEQTETCTVVPAEKRP